MRRWLWVILLLSAAGASGRAQQKLPGFDISPFFDEQVRELTIEPGVRVLVNAPAEFDAARPTLVIFYACPNGNSIEWTFGAKLMPGMDWHYDIQHIGAQTRHLREMTPERNIVLVILEADGRSWPAWRKKHPDAGERIRGIVGSVLALIPGETSVVLSGHSGGGSFITGYINGGESIGDNIERIAYLDANYSYDDAEGHGEKLLAWLRGDKRRRLVVIAYDDRNVTLDGKRVVSDTGGTYRASHRMIERFDRELEISHYRIGEFEHREMMDGQIAIDINLNPENRILHTALVGEMNGFLRSMTQGTPLDRGWQTFESKRAYTRWIMPLAAQALVVANATAEFPPRAEDAPGGKAFMEKIAHLPLDEREKAIVDEAKRGNVPAFLRRFKMIHVKVDGREARYEVMPDYLAVGSNEDFVRVPLTPMAAQKLADHFGWSLPTRRMVDQIYAQAELKLEPQPMTEKREAVTSFIEHNELIESQRGGDPPGALVAGIKKDVVITNRLREKPDRVAIYGWHQPGGKPIQPLTIVHGERYVDYSHGIRFVKRQMRANGEPVTIEAVLSDPQLAVLISDEGVIDPPRYP